MFRVIAITILICSAGFTQACFANISLSVNPVDGTDSLRFESVSGALGNKKEIHIRVNSSNGNQYQVFQRIIEPIMDGQGNSLNLQAIETQTLANSNSSGTLYLQNSDHLSMSDQLVYSSSQGGQGDSFLIGYSLNQNLMNSSGSFRGRIVFTVRGLGNAASDQASIDVFLDASSSSSLKIVVKGGRDPNRVHIHSTDTTEGSADLINFSFTGNTGQNIKIYQQVDNVPQNETDEDLGSSVLQLDAEGQTDGLRIQGLSSLASGRTLIYSSNKPEDNFVIYFLVNATQIQLQDAGSYTGRIRYIVQTDQGSQEITIDLECDVPPVFSITVTPPPEGVNFTHVLPNNPPQDKDVMVTVLSNLHKPYQVLQNLQTNMTNQEGKEFNSKYFTIQVQIPLGQKGQTNLTEFTPVQTGEYPVFSSDSRGSGATFEVVYQLQGYSQMSPGDFSAPLRFSLNQK